MDYISLQLKYSCSPERPVKPTGPPFSLKQVYKMTPNWVIFYGA